VLGVGAHLKNSVALAVGQQVFISQHIGDLETPQAYAAFERVAADLQAFYEVEPMLIAADAHSDYLSSRYAQCLGKPVVQVQHHYAHVLACMAEHGLRAPLLGVSWDGTGLGTDGTIWGGEFLNITPKSFERFAHFRTFGLPGGETAIKEPRRSALGLLYEIFGPGALERKDLAPVTAFPDRELAVLATMLRQRVNTPLTSSAGRLFDGVASLLGLRQRAAFEGQAAMDLEFALDGFVSDESYPVQAGTILDWEPLIIGIIDDLQKKLPAGLISVKFHNSLVEAIVQLARRAGFPDVVLSGGCFQNKYLTERAVAGLERAGFRPWWHRWVPPNDGGIALGQVAAVRRSIQRAN
jgi:hydrogenase maturation protein HypF